MRKMVLCLMVLGLSFGVSGLTGCSDSGVPKADQAPVQEPITPEDSGDRPEGFAEPESPL